jgi:hypothetical protein
MDNEHSAMYRESQKPTWHKKTALVGRFLGSRVKRSEQRSAAFFATLAWVLLVVGRDAALQATLLSMASGVANAFGGDRTGSGFAISFCTKFFGHDEWAPAGW